MTRDGAAIENKTTGGMERISKRDPTPVFSQPQPDAQTPLVQPEQLLKPPLPLVQGGAVNENKGTAERRAKRTSLYLTISVAAIINESDIIGCMSISGKYAIGHSELSQSEYATAWQYMYGEWLPNSGCQPRDAFPFEVYVSDPAANPGGKQLVDIYLPIEPLAKI